MSDMLDKYTIFDNFDKLDLSPIASLVGDSAVGGLSTTLSQILDNNESNISFNTYNETTFSSLDYKGRPIAYSSDNMGNGPVPDMFWYITNNRFYIDANGSVHHTSKLKKSLNELDEEYFHAQNTFNSYLAYGNLFYNDFFFNIHLSKFAPVFTDAVKLYNNPFYTPGTEQDYNNSIQNYFLTKNGVQVDNFTQLTQYTPPDLNTLAFFKPDLKAPSDYKLSVGNLFIPANPDYLSVLDNTGPMPFDNAALSLQIRSQAQLFLQRLLYPYKTDVDELPKHNYFVSDLKKSTSVGILARYNYTPPTKNQKNIKLEWQLPSIWAYGSYLTEDEYSAASNYYKDIVVLDNEDGITLEGFSLNKYYEISKDSQAYLDSANSPNSDDYSKFHKLLRHQTIIYGNDFHEKSKLIEEAKDFFPLYTQIELPPEKADLYGLDTRQDDALPDELLDIFMTLISSYFSSLDAQKRSSVHTFSLHDKNIDGTNISLTDLQILDLKSFNDNMLDLPYLPSNRFAFDDANLKQKSTKNDVHIQMDQVAKIREIIFNYSGKKALSYDKLRNGEKCHSEIIAFEVVKYGIDDDGIKTRLQSFFIPCHKPIGKRLVDTQVFYGKEYIYEVFSISLVVGSEYTSELSVMDKSPDSDKSFDKKNLIDPEYDNSSGGMLMPIKSIELVEPITLKVQSLDPFSSGGLTEILRLYTNIKPILVRAPYYNTVSIIGNKEQQNTIVLDKPPLPPEISFMPYKDISNKVLITLGVNYGKRRLLPVKVFSNDAVKIQKLFISQKGIVEETPFDSTIDNFLKPLSDMLLTYQTDDFRGVYKIWRTTKKPIGWGAFYDSTPVEIDNQENTAFEDHIQPNVDYYYFARFEDLNGSFSNPTDIFYLRMVKEGGFPPYLIVKTYNFSEGRPPRVYEKGLKKYLKVRLADNTREFYNTGDINKIDFGYKKANSNSELKKYKIRITSKKTGKKLDINIDFNKKTSEQYLKTLTTPDKSVPTESPLISDETTPNAYTTEYGLFVDPATMKKQTDKLEQAQKAAGKESEGKKFAATEGEKTVLINPIGFPKLP